MLKIFDQTPCKRLETNLEIVMLFMYVYLCK